MAFAGILQHVLKTIAAARLRPGMYLHQLGGAWAGDPASRSRFVLRDADEIASLLEAGLKLAVIDTSLGLDDVAADEATAPAPTSPAPPPLRVALPPAHPEMAAAGPMYQEALQVRERALATVIELFRQVRMGQALDPQTCLPVVDEVLRSLSEQPGALTSLVRLKTADDYTYLHAVACCALMISLARQLGMTQPQQREAGLAGLLLDCGKAGMPPELLNKPDRLSEAQMGHLHQHARLGHEILLRDGGFTPAVLKAVLHHHERLDGSGYPEGLAAERITPLARMAAICDVYDALTSQRPYREAWDPSLSMSHLAQTKGQFDTLYFHHFVKTLGIYPVGSRVRLHSGRLAVVVAQDPATLLRPQVRVFYNLAERRRLSPALALDLDDPNAADRIIGVEALATRRFPDLETLWLDR